MHCKIEKKKITDIVDSNIVQQTSFWANIKNRQGFSPLAFEFMALDREVGAGVKRDVKVYDDLLVLIQYFNDTNCFAYIPYGPEIEPAFDKHGLFLEELSEVLRGFLPKGCVFIRFDLPWHNQWAAEEDFFDEKGNWMGPPSHKSQEFRVNFNTNNWNLFKSPTNNLPSNTIFIDLQQGEENLLKKMKPKTRYNIRLSKRKGVRVQNYGMKKIDDWYGLYRETALRNNFTLHPQENFRSFLEFQKNKNVETRLLMADYEGQYLAAMFLVMSRKRGTYLYGASSGEKRNLMASYAVQWEAIRCAKREGCEEYDMFGTAPNAYTNHPMHGLYRFKVGFGGNLFHSMGCWDYPLMETEYQFFRGMEIKNQGYHNN